MYTRKANERRALKASLRLKQTRQWKLGTRIIIPLSERKPMLPVAVQNRIVKLGHISDA